MINKKVMVFFILSIFLVSSIGVVYAAIPTPADAIGKAFDKITKIFGMEFKDDQAKFVGFMRFLLWVLIFTLYYAGARIIFKGDNQKNTAIIVALILATISTLFIPKEVIYAIMTTYSTIVSVLFLGIPIVATVYLTMYVIPSDSRFWYFIKFIICAMVYVVLVLIVNAVEGANILAGAGVF